ncbi:hypothetical protein CC78DRAFT_582040 [Lojkania enalia]|uniref:Uncharacterized protein n=1 Tax=Lojkania enalia TaxID=147567 RepID=A0A9P4K6I4_9PLEO|nr:hypothetical protein CC78DRAFT_582040 [Didymosphaeria enalia]
MSSEVVSDGFFSASFGGLEIILGLLNVLPTLRLTRAQLRYTYHMRMDTFTTTHWVTVQFTYLFFILKSSMLEAVDSQLVIMNEPQLY